MLGGYELVSGQVSDELARHEPDAHLLTIGGSDDTNSSAAGGLTEIRPTILAKRVLVDSLSGYLKLLGSLIVGVLLVPLIVTRFGQEGYGLWTLSFSIVGSFSLLELGFGVATVKYVAECRGKNDDELRNRIVSSIGFAYLVLSALAVAGLAVMSMFYASAFSIPPEHVDISLAVLWLIGSRMLILAMPSSLFAGILYGNQQIAKVNLVSLTSILLYGVLGLSLLNFGYGLVALAAANLAAGLVEYGLFVIVAFRRTSNLRIAWSLVDRKLLRTALRYSGYQLLTSLGGFIFLKCDLMILKLFWPLSTLGVYAVAMKVFDILRLLLVQGAHVLSPFFAEAYARRDFENIRFVLIVVGKMTLGLTLLTCAAVAVLADHILYWWLGESFSGAVPVLRVMVVGLVFAAASALPNNALALTAYYRYTGRVAVFAATVNVVLSILVVQSYGMVGVAAASAFCYALWFALCARKICFVFDMPLHSYVSSTFLKPCFLCLLSATIAHYALNAVGFEPTALRALVQASIGGILFAGSFCTLVLSSTETEWLAAALLARGQSEGQQLSSRTIRAASQEVSR